MHKHLVHNAFQCLQVIQHLKKKKMNKTLEKKEYVSCARSAINKKAGDQFTPEHR